MGTRFGKNYPAHPILGARRQERERVMLVASAGLAFFLLIITLIVFNFKEDAIAAKVSSNDAIIDTPAAVGTVTLFVPLSSVRPGTKLSQVRFQKVYWPSRDVPPNAIRDLAEIRDKYAKVELPARMPVQRTSLTNEPVGVELPLTPGHRAVTIRVDEVSSLEGHALPGTRVDVALTYVEEGNLTTKVIVQNARVISYGGSTESYAERARSRAAAGSRRRATRVSRTITLDVPPKDALTIQTAKELGKLSLLMRAESDVASIPVDEIGKAEINKNTHHKKKVSPSCSRGQIRIGAREYMVDCSGRLHELDSYEP
ncbi:MAG: Flp pilus assembly protein CpaB [Candidatus Dadabacteria bacterium]|nr:MAG: Flp pilus assembly protein CpaB [Candidatus Dadabacteria bacterium]